MLRSQLSPFVSEWISNQNINTPEKIEHFFKKVFWIQDNFHFLELNPSTGKGTRRQLYPNDKQAVELAYASLSRGFEVEFLQQKLVDYRYKKVTINSMEDFIKAFFEDSAVGYDKQKKRISPEERKKLWLN